MTECYRPVLAISMGDPSGNGPELSVKALMRQDVYERARPLIVGDAVCLEEAKKVIPGARDLIIHKVQAPEDAVFTFGTIDVLDMGFVDIGKRLYKKDRKAVTARLGEADAKNAYLESQKMCGEAVFRYVTKVIDLAMKGEADATVTNALNKDYLNLAGHHYAGHTDIYADFTGTEKYTMLLAHGDLRVVHVSTHVSLREACSRVTKERVLDVIRIANEGCKALGIAHPKIGVAGLNPHCGENGLFGREEIEQIQPAIDAALAEGIDIPERAPTPPDTVFSKALGGWYDIVVVMYHDQGHIPLKVEGFVYDKEAKKWKAVEGVNITLGLPIIRTSVDHGTGEGHAGDGSANELSLVNAIDYAIKMARARREKVVGG